MNRDCCRSDISGYSLSNGDGIGWMHAHAPSSGSFAHSIYQLQRYSSVVKGAVDLLLFLNQKAPRALGIIHHQEQRSLYIITRALDAAV